MEYIPLLKQRRNALKQCSEHQQFPIEKRNLMKQNLKKLDLYPWIVKSIIVTGITFGVNWKKTVPFLRRQLPLSIGAIVVSAISDYLISEYVWKQHELDIVKLTGFKNGIYVSPQRMKKMRQKLQLPTKISDQDRYEDLQIQNDEQQILKS